MELACLSNVTIGTPHSALDFAGSQALEASFKARTNFRSLFENSHVWQHGK